MEKAKKPYKNRFSLRWSSKNVKNRRNGFLAKIEWHYLCREGRKNAHFRAHLAPIFFGPKQCKPGSAIKIVVSAELPQTKNDTFFF